MGNHEIGLAVAQASVVGRAREPLDVGEDAVFGRQGGAQAVVDEPLGVLTAGHQVIRERGARPTRPRVGFGARPGVADPYRYRAIAIVTTAVPRHAMSIRFTRASRS